MTIRFWTHSRLERARACRVEAPPSCLRKTALLLKSPTGAFVAPPAAGPYGLRLLIFSQPLGRALKNQNAAPTTSPCFCRRQRSSSLLFKSSYPLLQRKGKRLYKTKKTAIKSCPFCGAGMQSKSEPFPSDATSVGS